MQGETILCIAPRVWHSLWRDTQPVMWRVAQQNQVLYFEPGRNPDRPVLAEFVRNVPNFLTLAPQAVQDNLTVIPSPSSLPCARRHMPSSVLRVTTPLVAKVNAQVKIRHVRRAIQAFDVKAPILWLYSPYDVDLVGKFGEKLACYYNYDEFPDFVHNRRIKDLLRQFDNRLSSQVDVVFATSRAQCERRKQLNPRTYFVPNGVDFDLFHRALDPETPIPADIAGLNKPIIGCAGWLGYQIDVELLLRVAETYSDCSLVLVGPDEIPSSAGAGRLRGMPNVHFLGRKEQPSLPAYLKAFDVALIPYYLRGYTLSAYPLKLQEYLAAGRAVVSTALPELQPYSHMVRVAYTEDEFVHHIGQAFDDRSAQAIAARVAMARENTWDQRVAQIYSLLQCALAARQEETAARHSSAG
jgi:glycosyltransferase involved in cell wall biosynthesis